MKTIAALSSLLLLGATSVSAAPVVERQTQAPTEMDITAFSANTLPHGTAAFISFNIAIPNTSLSTTCSYTDHSSVSILPNVSLRPCDDPAVEWQFNQDPSLPGTSGQYRVVVTYAYDGAKKVAGFHEWPATDFPLEDFGSTTATFYRGEPDFVISNLS
ncbi:hypothetical protein F4821DRAFT_222882 [Hypoxylon rubiginosum]|uniref:Uncharacterized protein n=1 Tax=Hypoxylon rubiginosum TaxID=110542 RepID=A0ACC0DKU6_9PEZI|nr:hypothetical protein F4821DRAFT_222882 [Hypoxylon rubiginosum]